MRGDVPPEVTEELARSAEVPAQDEFEGHCPGAFDDWLIERGTPVLVYEIEHAGLPALCKRHLPGLEALLRALGRRAAVRPGGGAAAGGTRRS